MFQALQILTLVLVAAVLALSLAHVAEWPGKAFAVIAAAFAVRLLTQLVQ